MSLEIVPVQSKILVSSPGCSVVTGTCTLFITLAHSLGKCKASACMLTEVVQGLRHVLDTVPTNYELWPNFFLPTEPDIILISSLERRTTTSPLYPNRKVLQLTTDTRSEATLNSLLITKLSISHFNLTM